MFVDLDRLKEVNDTWGHETGDDLLVQVGRRLDQAVRPDDTVARLGGDEFVVVCPDIGDSQMHRDLPARLLETLARPIPLGRATVCVTASIGVVEAGDDADPSDVLRRADSAMYRAKRAGGNRSFIRGLDLHGSAEPGGRGGAVFSGTLGGDVGPLIMSAKLAGL